jgi:two-component system, OmpR family, KDP operon response regulator KdpE
MTGGINPLPNGAATAKHVAETNNSQERATSARPLRFTVGGRDVDLEAHMITADDSRINLTQIECKLLGHLGAQANRTVPSERLVELLWGRDPKRGAHNLRTVVKNVRRKLEPDPAHPVHLLLDRTRGYRLQLH